MEACAVVFCPHPSLCCTPPRSLVVTLGRAECCGVPYCAAMVCVLCRPCFLMFHPLPPLAPTLLSTPPPLQPRPAHPLPPPPQALLQALYQSLSDTTADRDQLLADSSSLAADLTRCATNLQTLVATLGFALRLPQELQHGLNAKHQGVFEEQLAALQQVGGGG